LGAVGAIIIGVAGVILISVARLPLSWANLWSAMVGRTAAIGIFSGALFGVSAVAYRSASLSLDGPDPIMQAAVTLAFVSTLQTLIMVAWMAVTDMREFGRVARAWRSSTLVGVAGILGSACWFTAMTLQQVAYVRALGQIELVFTFAASVFVFREQINRQEIAGCLLIVGGILLLLLGR
jgi:drug/metabolite transporter (DMT)-like permease